MLLTSHDCSIAQLKDFGLSIRNFLQELDKELPPHPMEHELTREEAAIIQLFKVLIRLKVATVSDQEDTSGQMVEVCHQMMNQADRIFHRLVYYLEAGH